MSGPAVFAVYVDGIVLGVGSIDVTISPDGKHVASNSIAQPTGLEPAEAYLDNGANIQHFMNGPPLFSPDSSHLAYASEEVSFGDWTMLLDASAEAASGLVFPTSDAQRDGSWQPNTDIDQQSSIENGNAYAGQYPYHFDLDGTLVYFRITGGRLYRIHWKPNGPGSVPMTPFRSIYSNSPATAASAK